jgi:hypothetical protein
MHYVELPRTSIERSASARAARDDAGYTKGYTINNGDVLEVLIDASVPRTTSQAST